MLLPKVNQGINLLFCYYIDCDDSSTGFNQFLAYGIIAIAKKMGIPSNYLRIVPEDEYSPKNYRVYYQGEYVACLISRLPFHINL